MSRSDAMRAARRFASTAARKSVDNFNTESEDQVLELLIYGGILGLAVVYVVPILANLVKGFIPASIAPNFTVPTAYPTTLTAGLWSIVFWGIFLALALWLISFVRPAREALQEGA